MFRIIIIIIIVVVVVVVVRSIIFVVGCLTAFCLSEYCYYDIGTTIDDK
jgi:hypothetical protein